MPFVYILLCSDNSYYTGSTVHLEDRLAQHQNGIYEGYTSSRRPVQLVWSQEVQTDNDAFHFERKIKGWSRAKKMALIRGDYLAIHEIVALERKQRTRRDVVSDEDVCP